MKAKLRYDSDGPNPAYDRVAAARAVKEDREYTVPHSRMIPAGTIVGEECEIGDRQCWKLCMPNFDGHVLADPADDECTQRVARARKIYTKSEVPPTLVPSISEGVL